jgi:hypothetical protein
MAEHGDAKLTALLATLATEKARSFSVYGPLQGGVRRALASELNPSSTITAPKPPRRSTLRGSRPAARSLG